jgi:hypothetical protein
MCTNEKKPHPWCENTVSHHGVDLAELFPIIKLYKYYVEQTVHSRVVQKQTVQWRRVSKIIID